MKIIVSLSFLLALTIVACTKKIVPTTNTSEASPTKITESIKKSEQTKPIETISPAMTPVPEKPSDNLAGKNIYTTKCSNCHALKSVGAYTFGQWEGILKSMIPNAKLSPDETIQVVAYIKANSK